MVQESVNPTLFLSVISTYSYLKPSDTVCGLQGKGVEIYMTMDGCVN